MDSKSSQCSRQSIVTLVRLTLEAEGSSNSKMQCKVLVGKRDLSLIK